MTNGNQLIGQIAEQQLMLSKQIEQEIPSRNRIAQEEPGPGLIAQLLDGGCQIRPLIQSIETIGHN
jgi:hypothetical protein